MDTYFSTERVQLYSSLSMISHKKNTTSTLMMGIETDEYGVNFFNILNIQSVPKDNTIFNLFFDRKLWIQDRIIILLCSVIRYVCDLYLFAEKKK